MSLSFGKVFLNVLAVSILALPTVASADTLSVSHEVKITASVAPMRYVVVNNVGIVQQIISNNSLSVVTPRAYYNSVTAGNELPMTADITQQYQALIKDIDIKPGIIYSRPAPIVSIKKHNSLTYISSIHKVAFNF